MEELDTSIIQKSFEYLRPHLRDTVDEFLVTLVESYPESKQLFFNSEQTLDEKLQLFTRWCVYIVDHCHEPDLLSGFLKSIFVHVMKDKLTRVHITWAHAALGKVLANKLNDEWKLATYNQWKLFISTIIHHFSELFETDAGILSEPSSQVPVPIKEANISFFANNDNVKKQPTPSHPTPEDILSPSKPKEPASGLYDEGVKSLEGLPMDMLTPKIVLPEPIKQELRAAIKKELEKSLKSEIEKIIREEIADLLKENNITELLKKAA